jgi:hypothetical protein
MILFIINGIVINLPKCMTIYLNGVYVYHISFLTLALEEKGVFNSYKKISMLHLCNWKKKCTLKQNFCSNLDLDTFANNIVGTSYHLKGSLFKINPKTTNKCISFLKLYTRESLQSALSYMSQWSVDIKYGTNR